MWDIFVLMPSIYLIIISLAEAIYFKTRSYFLFMKFGTDIIISIQLGLGQSIDIFRKIN